MRGKMKTAVNYVSLTKAKAKHQSMLVPRMQLKVQHQQSTSVTHYSAQSHSCKWRRRTSRECKLCFVRNAKCKTCGTVIHFASVFRKKQRVATVQEGALVDDNNDWVIGEAVFLYKLDSLDDCSQP